jgi:hypothetical protein
VGDSLEVYQSSPLRPDESLGVLAIDSTLKLLTLLGTFPSDYGTLMVSSISTVPFARVRLGRKNNYTVLQGSLGQWMLYATTPSDPELWFRELNRLINPLVTSQNPTAAQVGAARSFVQGLLGTLTIQGAQQTGQPPGGNLEALLLAYRVLVVHQIDTLIETFQARGSTRGLDILLQGRFQEFFGLTAESMTHGGYLREQIRAVSRLDMPVSKVDRHRDYAKQTSEGTWDDVDFTFVKENKDAREDVVVPTDFTEFTPPGF